MRDLHTRQSEVQEHIKADRPSVIVLRVELNILSVSGSEYRALEGLGGSHKQRDSYSLVDG